MKERPLPGIPTVGRIPCLPTFNVAPCFPNDALIPPLLMFRRSPFPKLNILRNRNGMGQEDHLLEKKKNNKHRHTGMLINMVIRHPILSIDFPSIFH